MALRPNPNKKFDQLKEAASRARLPFDKDVWLNIAFYMDEQYVEWADDFASIRRVPRREGFENTPRPVANKIMHFVNQEHAMALQTKPVPDVLPATDSPLDISDAYVTNAYLKYFISPQVGDFEAELADATFWALAGSEGFLKWTFNPRLKRPDVCSVSPLDLYMDPYAKQFNKCRYLIHSQFMDVEQVYDIWGLEVKASDVAKQDPTRASLLRDMGSSPVLQGVIVNELWMKPNRRYKDGLYVVWTNRDQLVEPQAFPYRHKRLPFTQLGSVPRPGSPHYSCAVKYLRSPQMELNRYHAQKISGREAFVNYKWWLPSELELQDPPNDAPRQILIGHSQGGSLKPEILAPPPMPDNKDGEWISQEMMNVVGLHEVSQAQVPGRVEAARAIELLKEADTSRLAELQRTTKASISEGMWQILMLAKQYVAEDIIVQTYSQEGIPEVRKFKTQSIKPGMRIQVTMGTGLASSRAARQDQLMLFWQNGIIQDPEVMADLMDMPISTMEPSKVFDIRLARNENLTIAAGTAITPNSWDDHERHIKEHNNFRKTHEFMLLPGTTKSKFEFHVQKHTDMQMQQLQKQMELAQMAQGAPAAGGAGDQAGQSAPGGAPASEAPPGGPPSGGGQGPFDSPQGQASGRAMVTRNLGRAGEPVQRGTIRSGR